MAEMPSDSFTSLVASRAAHVRWARRKLWNADAAEDAVQTALERVLSHAAAGKGAPREVLPWFRRVLANVVVDIQRHRQVGERAATSLVADRVGMTEQVSLPCRCVPEAVASLSAPQRDVLAAIELEGFRPAELAGMLRITANAATVRAHRARRALANGLRRTCGDCARDGCAECSCKGSRPRP